jgi:hypothetical protein
MLPVRLPSTHHAVDSGRRGAKNVPLFPYFPIIVWMGMIKVVLDATHDNDAPPVIDPTILTTTRASVVPFPMPGRVAAVG